MLNETELKNRFSELLDCDFQFVVSKRELSESELSSSELKRLEEMRHERRRTSWLRGRSALKQILLSSRALQATDRCSPSLENDHYRASKASELCSASMAIDQVRSADLSALLPSIDTCLLSFPHPRISLSHTDAVAVAVYLEDSAAADGIGIDIEGPREVRSAMKKFYLTQSEQESISETNENLLRLWTVKESLFKSDMQNKDKTMLKYEIEDATLCTGNGSTEYANLTKRFKYASIKFGDFWLSVSIAISGDRQ